MTEGPRETPSAPPSQGIRAPRRSGIPLVVLGGAVVGAAAAVLALTLATRASSGDHALPPPAASPRDRPASAPPAHPATSTNPSRGVHEPTTVLVRGAGALDVSMGADRIARAAGGAGPALTFASGGAAAPTGRTGIVFDRTSDAVVLREWPRDDDAEPDEGLVPPRALVGPVLAGVPFVATGERAGALVAATTFLLLGDVDATRRALAEGGADRSGAIVLGYADVLAGIDPESRLRPLAADPRLGAVAHFLLGASLLARDVFREARVDLDAARNAAPALWPAALLSGFASQHLAVPDDAVAAESAALERVPRNTAVRFALASSRATTNPAKSIAELESIVAERPSFASAWRVLGSVHARLATKADNEAAALAFARWAALRPKEPAAWDALAQAHAAVADTSRTPDSLDEAAKAYAKLLELRPDDGIAWFDRGAMLQKSAYPLAASRGEAWFRARLLEARACYVNALARGLPTMQGALAYSNLGVVLDTLPPGAAPVSPDVPSTAAAAFEAAHTLVPSSDVAALALVAARVAERDAVRAKKALDEVPAGADPAERGALEAAVQWLVANPKAPPPPPKKGESDPLASLARGLLASAYYRTVAVLLEGEEHDAERIAQRARAHAFLVDKKSVDDDLVRLRAIDPARAEQVAQHPAVAALAGRR